MNLDILDNPYDINSEQIDFYRESSFIKLKEVLTPEVINYFNSIISDKVEELNTVEIPIEQRDTYGKAFLQLFNLWTRDEIIKKLVFSKRIAKIATELMQTNGVRLYHDQALFKEAGGGITPWHADQHYWPLSTDKTITVWIPLQKTPLEMGPLEFSKGSQRIALGRELSISDESEIKIKKNLKINNFPHIIEPFDIGEVSFHSGWIFHRAGANVSDKARKVMTIIYIDRNMTLKKPENEGHLNDAKTWCPGVKIGDVIQSELNPLLYTK
jgi:ectoine hydroxylase-related dioxygenase (phytanoyl-CoA dioxygenase family)